MGQHGHEQRREELEWSSRVYLLDKNSSLMQLTHAEKKQKEYTAQVVVCLQGHNVMTSFSGNYHLGQLKGTVKSQLERFSTSSSNAAQVITCLRTAVCVQFTWGCLEQKSQVSDLQLSLKFTFYTENPLFSYRTQQPIISRYDALPRYRKACITQLQSNLFIYFTFSWKWGKIYLCTTERASGPVIFYLLPYSHWEIMLCIVPMPDIWVNVKVTEFVLLEMPTKIVLSKFSQWLKCTKWKETDIRDGHCKGSILMVNPVTFTALKLLAYKLPHLFPFLEWHFTHTMPGRG